jgi:hypothetical protein
MITAAEREILDRDYPRSKTDRATALKFNKHLRGSMRLVRGLFRTEDEEAAFVAKGLKIKLPGSR